MEGERLKIERGRNMGLLDITGLGDKIKEYSPSVTSHLLKSQISGKRWNISVLIFGNFVNFDF